MQLWRQKLINIIVAYWFRRDDSSVFTKETIYDHETRLEDNVI